MPETYGQPEDELTRAEKAQQVAEAAIAGSGVLRTVLLYGAAFILVVSPVAPLAVLPLAFLIATDKRLA